MTSGFLVQNVRIEGFKAFTTEQEIDLGGRHVFLLGQNGNGKSSIIEAIRWGLFGSTGRPNEIVANRGYAGACRVEVALMREGKRWNFRRTLIRGASGGSDAVLTDDQGKEHAIREIMPQLNSVDAGEGTHIIFAPQATPLRRQPEDLNAFERTVFNHLGLTYPRALLSQIRSFLVLQQELEVSLAKRLEEKRHDVDSEIAHLERQRGIILRSPPWEGSKPPSVAESQKSARGLIEEISDEQQEEMFLGLSLEALLQEGEEALDNKRDQAQEGLKKKLSAITGRRDRLIALSELNERVGILQNVVEAKQSELNALLNGLSIGGLRNTVQEKRSVMQTRELRSRIAEEAKLLLEQLQAEDVSCPVCGTLHNRKVLQAEVSHESGQLMEDENSDLSVLETQLQSVEDLEQEVKRQEEALWGIEKRVR